MSVVRHRSPEVGAPRNRSDLRAAAGILPRKTVARVVGGPVASSEQLRVARVNGVVVGACRITPEVMRLGESRLKLGVIRNMAVHPQFEPRSVRESLFEDARRFLTDHRYHVALTTGLEFELRLYGFTPALCPTLLRLHRSTEESPQFPYRVRLAKQGDIAAMSRLYSAAFEKVAGSIVRVRAHLARIWTEYAEARVVTDAEGKVVAYFVPRVFDGNLIVTEFAFDAPFTVAQMKHLLLDSADKNDCAAVFVFDPPACSFPLGAEYPSYSPITPPVGFLATIDLDELFQSMIPEWECRIAVESRVADVEMTLFVDDKPFRLRAHRGAITVESQTGANRVMLSESDLVQALLGATAPRNVLTRELRLLHPEAVALFETVFPMRIPGISPLDLV